MARKAKRLATDYLQVGDLVVIPDSLPAPIVYLAGCPNGKTVRQGRVAELLNAGMIAVDFGGKVWDYSNSEALQFRRVY